MTVSARIAPIRVRTQDTDLHTTRVYGVGFSATCECGERSPRCASVAMARGWLTEHRRSCRA